MPSHIFKVNICTHYVCILLSGHLHRWTVGHLYCFQLKLAILNITTLVLHLVLNLLLNGHLKLWWMSPELFTTCFQSYDGHTHSCNHVITFWVLATADHNFQQKNIHWGKWICLKWHSTNNCSVRLTIIVKNDWNFKSNHMMLNLQLQQLMTIILSSISHKSRIYSHDWDQNFCPKQT